MSARDTNTTPPKMAAGMRQFSLRSLLLILTVSSIAFGAAFSKGFPGRFFVLTFIGMAAIICLGELLLRLAIWVNFLGARNSKASVVAHLQHAWHCLTSGEYDRAIDTLQVPIEIGSNLERAAAFEYRGIAWYHKQEYEKAVQDTSEAIRLTPSKPHSHYYRGMARLALEDFEKALEDLDEAIRLDSTLAWQAEYAKCSIYVVVGRYGDAMETANAWTDHKTKEVRSSALTMRGAARTLLGQHDGAIADFTETLRLTPTCAVICHQNRGYAQLLKGNYEAAINDCSEAIRIDPEHPLGYFYRGWAKFEGGDYAGAIADLSEAIRRDPDFAQAYKQRAAAYEATGQTEQASEDRATALALDPNVESEPVGVDLRYWKVRCAPP